MKETICHAGGMNYKLEYHRLTTNDGSIVYEGILFQDPPLLFSISLLEDNRVNFSPLKTPITIQESIKKTIETAENVHTKDFC